LPSSGWKFFGIGGLGLWGATFKDGGSGELIAGNVGVGAKRTLGEAFKLRVDYRMYLVGDAPDASPGFKIHRHPQRLSVGIGFWF
jgi:hypothetical protein